MKTTTAKTSVLAASTLIGTLLLSGCAAGAEAEPAPSSARTASATPVPSSSASPTPVVTEATISPELQSEVDALVAGASMLYHTASETNFNGTFDKILTGGPSVLVKMQLEALGDTTIEVMNDGPLSGDDWSFIVEGTTESSTWWVSRNGFSSDPEDHVVVTFVRDTAPTVSGNGKYAGVTFSGE